MRKRTEFRIDVQDINTGIHSNLKGCCGACGETDLGPAMPRSCQHNSAACASPVAPRGCPLEIRPPLGFTTHCVSVRVDVGGVSA